MNKAFVVWHIMHNSTIVHNSARQREEEEEESRRDSEHWAEIARERTKKASEGTARIEELTPGEEKKYRVLIVDDESLVPPKGFVKIHTDDGCRFFNVAGIVRITRCREEGRRDKAEIRCSDGWFTYETDEKYEEVVRLIAEAAAEN